MSNPFLVGADPAALAAALEPGQQVRVRYHSFGSGLGGGRQDFDTTGEFLRDDGFNVVVREDAGGVMNYIPKFWLDEVEVIDG